MRVLIVTKIFPNRAEPHSCAFNRQQFAALARRCDVELWASIPWFPGAGPLRRWSRAGRLLSVPRHELIDGLAIEHPRFVYLPKIGNAVSGPLYAASLAPSALARRGAVDVVLGSWAYPDGFAALILARLLGVPAVVKVHGSDINVLARERVVEQRLRWALPRAARVVAVSQPLASRVRALGVAPDHVDVVPNGVDSALFRPLDRARSRARLGLAQGRPTVLFVGRVERAKGVTDLIRALSRVESASLVVVGDGDELGACRRLASELGIDATFAGEQPHRELPHWIAASDLLALPSWNEGTPNAVLEALACGRRVVATDVGGIPDVVATPLLGELVPPRSVERLAATIARALTLRYDPVEVARVAAIPSWDESAARLHASLVAARAAPRREAA